MSLSLNSEPRDEVTVISVSGELDLVTAPKLAELTGRLLEQGHRRLVSDLSGLAFCDSTGLAVFVRTKNRMDQQGGRMSLAAPSTIVYRVLEVSGLLEVLRRP
jgi:anti-sigma B factor antagonist